MTEPADPIGLLLRAAFFAAHKHKDQRRKDAGSSPYINHPLTLATVLHEDGDVDDADVIAAALLHDTVEDTETSYAELRGLFGLADKLSNCATSWPVRPAAGHWNASGNTSTGRRRSSTRFAARAQSWSGASISCTAVDRSPSWHYFRLRRLSLSAVRFGAVRFTFDSRPMHRPFYARRLIRRP
jgi:hypothetical protein